MRCVVCYPRDPDKNEAWVGGSFATLSRVGVVLINMTSRTEQGKTKSNFCSSVLAPLCCMTRGQVLAAAALEMLFCRSFVSRLHCGAVDTRAALVHFPLPVSSLHIEVLSGDGYLVISSIY